MSLGRIAKLNTGANIPLFGLGTWQSKPDVVKNAVKVALDAGYRHIDAAWIYGNEKEVGEAIRESNIPREQLFVTTKLWNNSHRPEDVLPALETSLKNLGLEYVDLYLMHWPIAFKSGPAAVARDEAGQLIFEDVDITATYQAMEKLVETGKTKAIGVSNYSIKNLEKILSIAKIVPAANQVELHPENPQWELLEFCKAKGIHVTAYSPLGSTDSPLIKRDEISKIAAKHNTNNANVLIAWGQQRGTSVIPKSVTESRIISNFKDIELDQEDLAALKALVEGKAPHRYCDPKEFWGVDIFN
ncbi:MAG: NADP-dependent oxidoreductase domain-containing protein [Linnemannia elongata]|nr:MAG: NADP-dependent oxidoreductase domain-containing protein [Linnemannia elongata]